MEGNIEFLRASDGNISLPKFFNRSVEERGSKYTVFVVVLILVVIDSLFYSIIIPIIPIYAVEHNISEAWVGILFASFPFAYLVASPPTAKLVERFRKKPVLVGAVTVLIAATLGYAFAPSYWFLLIARVLQGASSGATWVAGLAMVSDHFLPNEQGSVYGKVVAAVGVGIFAGPLIGGWLFQWSGSQKVPFIVCSIFLLFDLAALIFVRDVKALSEHDHDETSMTTFLKDRTIILLVVTYSWCNFLSTGEEPVFPLYFYYTWQLSSGYIGAMFGLLLFSFTCSSLAVGRACDRFPSKRLHFIAVGITISTVVYPAIMATDSIPLSCVLLVLLGISSGMVTTPPLPLINQIVESKYKTKKDTLASTLLNVGYSVGAILGPIVQTFLVDVWGFLRPTFATSAVSLLLSILIIWEIFRSKQLLENYKPVLAEEATEDNSIQMEETKI